jgi:hypothetical protein
LKASPRTQPLRWEEAFNPQNTQRIPPVKRPFPALILGTIEDFQAASYRGLKASPRTQPLRWEKAFNPQNTQRIPAAAATLSSKSGLTIKILLNTTTKALYYLMTIVRSPL